MLTKLLILTFLILFAALIIISLPDSDIVPAGAQTVWSNSNAAPRRPPAIDDFVPEFRELPDFGETTPKFSAKLVDVSSIGNSYYSDEVIAKTGETWLGLFWNSERLEFRKTKVARHPRTELAKHATKIPRVSHALISRIPNYRFRFAPPVAIDIAVCSAD